MASKTGTFQWVQPWPNPQIVNKAEKKSAGTNTLAYFAAISVTNKKSFVTSKQVGQNRIRQPRRGTSLIKLFSQ